MSISRGEDGKVHYQSQRTHRRERAADFRATDGSEKRERDNNGSQTTVPFMGGAGW